MFEQLFPGQGKTRSDYLEYQDLGLERKGPEAKCHLEREELAKEELPRLKLRLSPALSLLSRPLATRQSLLGLQLVSTLSPL